MMSLALTVAVAVVVAWNIGTFFAGQIGSAMDVLLAAVR